MEKIDDLMRAEQVFINTHGQAYKILGRLGSGGSAQVFETYPIRGNDTTTVNPLAVKIFHDNDFAAKMFSLESKAARLLGAHPHIIQTTEAGAASVIDKAGEYVSSFNYLLMEYAHGGAVAEQQPLPLTQAARMGRHVLSALDYIHGRGLIHRDIKPDNILMTGQQRLPTYKLGDFGAVDSAYIAGREDTRQKEVLLTRRYAPDEINTRRATGQTDLYSLGLTMAEAITGLRARQEDGSILSLEELAESVNMPRDAFMGELSKLLRKATQEDPRKRFQDAAAMQDAIIKAQQKYGRYKTGTDSVAPEWKYRELKPQPGRVGEFGTIKYTESGPWLPTLGYTSMPKVDTEMSSHFTEESIPNGHKPPSTVEPEPVAVADQLIGDKSEWQSFRARTQTGAAWMKLLWLQLKPTELDVIHAQQQIEPNVRHIKEPRFNGGSQSSPKPDYQKEAAPKVTRPLTEWVQEEKSSGNEQNKAELVLDEQPDSSLEKRYSRRQFGALLVGAAAGVGGTLLFEKYKNKDVSRIIFELERIVPDSATDFYIDMTRAFIDSGRDFAALAMLNKLENNGFVNSAALAAKEFTRQNPFEAEALLARFYNKAEAMPGYEHDINDVMAALAVHDPGKVRSWQKRFTFNTSQWDFYQAALKPHDTPRVEKVMQNFMKAGDYWHPMQLVPVLVARNPEYLKYIAGSLLLEKNIFTNYAKTVNNSRRWSTSFDLLQTIASEFMPYNMDTAEELAIQIEDLTLATGQNTTPLNLALRSVVFSPSVAHSAMERFMSYGKGWSDASDLLQVALAGHGTTNEPHSAIAEAWYNYVLNPSNKPFETDAINAIKNSQNKVDNARWLGLATIYGRGKR